MIKRERDDSCIEEPTSKESKYETIPEYIQTQIQYTQTEIDFHPMSQAEYIAEHDVSNTNVISMTFNEKEFCDVVRGVIGERAYNFDYTLSGPIDWSIWCEHVQKRHIDNYDVYSLLALFVEFYIDNSFGSYEIQIFMDVIIDNAWLITREGKLCAIERVRSIIEKSLELVKNKDNFGLSLMRANNLYNHFKHHFKYMKPFTTRSGTLLYGSFDKKFFVETNPIPDNDFFELIDYKK